MPISYAIHPDRHIAIVRFSGALSEQEVHAFRLQFTTDPTFDRTYGLLIDLRDASEVMVSSTGLDALAAQSAFDPRARRAIVVGSIPQFGVAREFVTINERYHQWVRVFAGVPEAEAWLAADARSPDGLTLA